MTLLIETLTHDPYVQAALTVCAERGIAACLVGGAVRDLLLGRPVHDWDWAVERDAISLARATADRLGAAFFPLDQERDTGRVVIRDADGSRTFLDFALRRGPDWHADLEARDFTVNAMAVPLAETGGCRKDTASLARSVQWSVRPASSAHSRRDRALVPR